ncbi:hypothetical protein HDV00_004372 [Rhizophlyctis rosea]|nr:hypothetical protein HDV00_004372 [Rhizophlyctis rosea]
MFSDMYMKRNFRYIQKRLKPETIFFLGDLMDGGREWDTATYDKELRRLDKVFRIRDEQTNVYWIAGNHDIGFGAQVVPGAYERFHQTFGELNYNVTIADNLLVVLDTVSLSGDGSNTAFREADDFLKDFENGVPIRSPILFSHVPLYRPDDSSCGKKRRQWPMRQGHGYQSQNLVSEPLTNRILKSVRPALVLSGHDHDDCIYYHESIPEHTIATFSFLQGNLYPGFGLLSLKPPPDNTTNAPTFAFETCGLAPQLIIYEWYLALAVLTLLLAPLWAGWSRRHSGPAYVEIPLYQQRWEAPRWAGEVGPSKGIGKTVLGWWTGLNRKAWEMAGVMILETIGVGGGLFVLIVGWEFVR